MLLAAFALAFIAHPATDHEGVVPAAVKWVYGPASLSPDAKMVILEGDPAKIAAFFLGRGEKFDPKAAREMPAGSYGRTGVGMKHFGYVKCETVIQLHGEVPWATEYVNPADDPRKKK